MCQLEQKFLHEYIDGSLEPLERIILEEHLRGCLVCRQELNRLKIIDWDLHKLYEEEISIPPELVKLRQKVLKNCLSEETSQATNTGAISSSDIWNLQVATLNNSLKFITLLSAKSRNEKTKTPKPSKKSSLLRKIIGL